MRDRRESAFTLIELLVVCVLIALVLTFTIPAITGLSKSNELNAGGRLISNLLAAARSDAINHRRMVQVRIATKWMMTNGTEDTTSSYRKFSVWRRPQPDDAQQATGSDPYIQISKWETLPTGITFEIDPSPYNFTTTTSDPRYLGTNLFNNALNNRTPGVVAPANSTVDVAWVGFAPTGAANVGTSSPGKVYLLVTEGFWNGTIVTTTNRHANWLATTVDTLMGRSAVLRP